MTPPPSVDAARRRLQELKDELLLPAWKRRGIREIDNEIKALRALLPPEPKAGGE